MVIIIICIEESGKKFVLRMKKSGEKQFLDSLEKENSFLRYFEDAGLTFCPTVVYYDKENHFLIEKFIKGDDLHQPNFSDEHIDLFAKQLHDMFNPGRCPFLGILWIKGD